MPKPPGLMRVGGPGGRSNSPLVFIGVVLAVMVGAMAWLATIEDEERERVPVVPVPEQQPAVIETDAVPWRPQIESWGRISDGDRDAQRDIPVGALAVAANRAAAHSWANFKLFPVEGMPDRVGFLRLDVPEVFRSSDRLRGLPFEVLGELRELEEIDVFDTYQGMKLPGDRTTAWRGIIVPRLDLHGSSAPVSFLMVDEPRSEDMPAVGDDVKLQGVFFKLQEVELGGEREVGPWMLGKRLYLNFRVPAPEEVDLGLLDGLEDVKEASKRRHPFEERAFFHLVGDVLGRPGRDRGEPLDLSGQEIQKVVREPGPYRGKTVTFQARVLKVEQIPMGAFFEQNSPGDNAIDEVWTTYVTTDGVVPLTVTWLRKPNLDLSPSDQVRMTGVFYRLWGYRGRGGQWVKAPLLVGMGDIEVIDVEKGTGMSRGLAIGLSAFAFLVLVVIFILVRHDRNRSELFRRSRAAKKKLDRGALDLNAVARSAGASDGGGDAETPR